MTASVRDRTGLFRQIVREVALRKGFDQERLKQITSSWILPRVAPKSPFMNTAKEILNNVRMLEGFIAQNKRNYLDCFRSTEAERDDIEHQVGLFVRTCKELIDVLTGNIASHSSTKYSLSWVGSAERTNRDANAHRHGVVLILSERLHEVTAAFDKLRAVRFQEAIQRSTSSRRLRPAVLGVISKADTVGVIGRGKYPSSGDDPQDGEEVGSAGTASQQQMMLDEETRALQAELSSLADSVKETESKLLEVSALGHLFSTHVLQQAQQIERLYKDAVEATHNVDMGNKEIVKTISRNSTSRVFLLLFFMVLIFTILFLDWYK